MSFLVRKYLMDRESGYDKLLLSRLMHALLARRRALPSCRLAHGPCLLVTVRAGLSKYDVLDKYSSRFPPFKIQFCNINNLQVK
jgi:hypothetical protein